MIFILEMDQSLGFSGIHIPMIMTTDRVLDIRCSCAHLLILLF